MAISNKTRKNLWAKSGNRCAICKTELFAETDSNDKYNIGEECHIISSKPNGPRHKPNIKDYDTFDNLIMLCRNHHKEIDELTDTYTEELLRYIKQNHETWVQKKLSETQNSSEKDILRFITRITTGKELSYIIFNSIGYRIDHDEIEDEYEANYIAEIIQTLIDYGEISSMVEAHEKVKMTYELKQILDELEDKGYFIFGEKNIEKHWGIKDCPIANLLIKKATNEEIIKVQIKD